MNRGIYIALAVVLTARLGRVTFNDHPETYYNLNMRRICERAQQNGIQGEYTVREDGVKMYGPFVIVAADWNIHPYGSLVDTSLGMGIVLDTHTAKDRTMVDIATNWGKGGKK